MVAKKTSKPNPENERVKYKYLSYLPHVGRVGPTTVSMAAAAIVDFEKSVGGKNFKLFKPDWAIKYKEKLENEPSPRTGQPLAPSTVVGKLRYIQSFFLWLSDQEGYRSRVRRSDVDYFNTSLRLTERARSRNSTKAPTLEQIRHVIQCLPSETEVERCIRAMMAFVIVSGGRADAVASMKLGNVDLENRVVSFNGRTTRTKGARSYIAGFFPVDDEFISIVADWVVYLLQERLFGPDDPLFPSAEMTHDSDRLFAATGRVTRVAWKSSEPLRRHFEASCEKAGVPYFNPHSVRTTLGRLGLALCETFEDMKAFSQSLGHASIDTTARYYGRLNDDRQCQVMQDLFKRAKEILPRPR